MSESADQGSNDVPGSPDVSDPLPDAQEDDEYARFESVARKVVNTPKPTPEDEPAAG